MGGPRPRRRGLPGPLRRADRPGLCADHPHRDRPGQRRDLRRSVRAGRRPALVRAARAPLGPRHPDAREQPRLRSGLPPALPGLYGDPSNRRFAGIWVKNIDAVLCCGGPRQGHTSGSTTRWSSGRDATAPARAVPAAVPGALRHGHPQAARRQRPPHRSGRSSDSATSSDPSSSSSVAPAPGRSSSRPRSSPTPTPACCSGRCWVRTKVAEPTVLQYAPACTCTCPLTCANADGRCRQQRRCPLYVRARGLPSADPRGQPRTLSAQPA